MHIYCIRIDIYIITALPCATVYHTNTGDLLFRFSPRVSWPTDSGRLVAMPDRPFTMALIGPEKGTLVDLKGRKAGRSLAHWNGVMTRDGAYGIRCIAALFRPIYRPLEK